MTHPTSPDSATRTRRNFLARTSAALALVTPSLHAAATLPRTPRQSLGPFYPVNLPLDQDNDLIQVAGKRGFANGIVTHISGRISDDRGRAISAAVVEIWQCNAFGRYHHPRDRHDVPVDENFQGYGRFTTDDNGLYRFRTIKPVPYPGRTPHIHFAVSTPGGKKLVTQMYVAGEPGNAHDGLLNSIRDARARASLIVTLLPVPGAANELAGTFDLVLMPRG